ncbi:hypothetical protein FQR65_LT13431 [Abscondita terminalis]|nr:hypothetical protein FQR65_LT13431 [Abscondita terminalis]
MQRHKPTAGDGTHKIREELNQLKLEHTLLKSENEENLFKIQELEKTVMTLQKTLQSLENGCLNLSHLNSNCVTKTDNFKSVNDILTKEKIDLEIQMRRSLKHMNDQQNIINSYEQHVQELEEARRIMHNQIQDLKGTIRVFCRVRPQLAMNKKDSINNPKSNESYTEFVFDKVFEANSSQQEVFAEVAQLVQSAVDGYNVCIFAYGQTGSGKTYTMQGETTNNCLGVIPKSVDLIFRLVEKYKLMGWGYVVEVSFLEIYNEMINDLLNANAKESLEIRFNEGKGTTVKNLTTFIVQSADELSVLMNRAYLNRAVAVTNFNEHSSRSHSVTKITLTGTNDSTKTIYCGSLNLVDLAGSESARTSDRITETKSINQSLSALGSVITALQNKDSHIPYRNSKLTYLLQSSLGGNSKTLMIVNIAPLEDCYNESINTLRFATKVKKVKILSKKNKITL